MISDESAIYLKKDETRQRVLNACNNMHFICVTTQRSEPVESSCDDYNIQWSKSIQSPPTQRPESVFWYSTPNRQTEMMELVPPTNNMNANSTVGMILIDQAYHTITCGMVGDAIKNHWSILKDHVQPGDLLKQYGLIQKSQCVWRLIDSCANRQDNASYDKHTTENLKTMWTMMGTTCVCTM